MIVVDTSALMAIALEEPEAAACHGALRRADGLFMSAGTFTETLIVAKRRGFGVALSDLIEGLAIEIVPVTEAAARRAAEAYGRWGRGFHPAALNYGDCFAYELATTRAWPLLFVGDDFARTDVARVL